MSKKQKVQKKNKPSRPNAVSYTDFVKVWNAAGSVADVAKKLGIKNNSASAIASRLRASKVKLKMFPRRPAQAIDVAKLNRLSSAR